MSITVSAARISSRHGAAARQAHRAEREGKAADEADRRAQAYTPEQRALLIAQAAALGILGMTASGLE